MEVTSAQRRAAIWRIPRRWARQGRRRPPATLFVVAFAVALVALAPVGFLFDQTFSTGWDEIERLLFRRYVGDLLVNTTTLVAVGTAACTGLGVAIAWLVERTDLPGRRVWAVLAALPITVPAFVTSYSWVSITPAVQGFWGAAGIVIAGCTVVIAVLGLFVTGLPYMYGVAISASLAVLVVMLAAVTLLPALLSYLGPRVDRLRIPFLGRSLDAEANGESPAARWSHAVQRRPWTATIVATAILLALAAPALGMRLGFPDAGNDRPGTMTREAYDLLTEGFGPGSNGPLVIAAELPDRAAASDVDALAVELRDEEGVAFVPDPVINDSGSAALVTVIPTTSPQDEATQDLVKRLRGTVIPDALAGSGVNAEVGGVTAALEDQSTYIVGRMPWFIAAVVGLSFLLLLVAFHSPLISLKAGVMNLLSVSAAYGVMTLVAQGGAVGELIGIDHEVPIAPFMPVMMFAILFGLSMDYEVFLVSRIREEYLKDGDTRRAVADGLAKTARVITAAAAIMVVVFLAFVASPEVFLKLFGIGLASAIFLDATVVRMVLVPAVMQLLDNRNWWIPDWLERALPKIDVERRAPGMAEGRP
jgi:putative drug exporter of the RND superfamily